MIKAESFSNHALKIDVKEDDNLIVMKWAGRSIARKPAEFIMPILVKALEKSVQTKKKIVLDFRQLEYMNSSTITPVIKILERARTGTSHIAVLYRRTQRWQELSFSALKVFETKEDRVRIIGSE